MERVPRIEGAYVVSNPKIFGSKIEEQKLNEISHEHGFTRSYSTPRGRRTRTKGPLRALNISMPEEQFERFVKICDEMDKTYWQALCELMDMYESKGE